MDTSKIFERYKITISTIFLIAAATVFSTLIWIVVNMVKDFDNVLSMYKNSPFIYNIVILIILLIILLTIDYFRYNVKIKGVREAHFRQSVYNDNKEEMEMLYNKYGEEYLIHIRKVFPEKSIDIEKGLLLRK